MPGIDPEQRQHPIKHVLHDHEDAHLDARGGCYRLHHRGHLAGLGAGSEKAEYLNGSIPQMWW